MIFSCQENQLGDSGELVSGNEAEQWNVDSLGKRATEHLDNNKWDKKLLSQDIETYVKYTDVFGSYPLNKSPFPVAEYDYAVSGVPFTLQIENAIFKGVRIGEFVSMDNDEVSEKLTLMVLTNNKSAVSDVLVESRNFPYLTAQGYFKVSNNDIDWVFNASPDGYSTLMVNMKLFDLRFGETVIIFPQIDTSFFYEQINDSPDNYKNTEDFENALKTNKRILEQIKSERNIK